MNERYFLTPRNSFAKDGLEALGQGHKAFGQDHKAGLEAFGQDHKAGLKALGQDHQTMGLSLGKEVGKGLGEGGLSLGKEVGKGLGEGLRGFGKEVKTGLEVFGICFLSASVILGLSFTTRSRRWPRNVRYVFVKTVNRNVSH